MHERSVLLNNVLDALDRLFDRESSLSDVFGLIYASAHALRSDVLYTLLSDAATSLEVIIKEGSPMEVSRERALGVTNSLRIALAESLP